MANKIVKVRDLETGRVFEAGVEWFKLNRIQYRNRISICEYGPSTEYVRYELVEEEQNG